MGQGTQQQLTLEGIPIAGLRASLQAVHFTPERPLRSGERGRLVIDFFVSELRFPYAESEDVEDELPGSYKLRQHMLVATSFRVAGIDGVDEEAIRFAS